MNKNFSEEIQLDEMVQQVLPLALVHGKVLLEKPKDLFIPPDALAIILEQFEGPLDLLLYLIRKQKLDIMALPIASITRQYIEYIELMKEAKLALATEYLVMAAILMEIKSRLLLPKQVVEETEEADPRAELIRRLQAYEVIKDAAEKIDDLPRIERDNYIVHADLADNFMPRTLVAEVDLAEMVTALNEVMKRSAAFEHHHIQRETFSTRERMSAVLVQLEQTQASGLFLEFSQLFKFKEGRTGVVVTFLAILELLKASLIECIQTQVYGQLQVRLKP